MTVEKHEPTGESVPKPLAPSGKPEVVRHEEKLSLESLSREDLVRFVDTLTSGVDHPRVDISWKDGSSSALELPSDGYAEQIYSIQQVEMIDVVWVSCSFADGSRISCHIMAGYQRIASRAPVENSIAQQRVYKLRNEAMAGGAKDFDDRFKARRRSRAWMLGAGVLSLLLLSAYWIMFANGVKSGPLTWALTLSAAAAVIVEWVFIIIHRRQKISTPQAVVLAYPPAPEKKPWLDNWAAWAGIVGTIVALITLIITIWPR